MVQTRKRKPENTLIIVDFLTQEDTESVIAWIESKGQFKSPFIRQLVLDAKAKDEESEADNEK